MVDLDELERLLHAARRGREHEALLMRVVRIEEGM